MGKRSGPSMLKRQKEVVRQTRNQEKAARRKAAKEESGRAPTATDGEDPDIAGIVPGPQRREPSTE